MNRTIFAMTLLAGLSYAQDSASALLSSKRLATHAYLPQYNQPVVSLRQQLADAKVQAAAKGVFKWNGLDIVVSDSEVLSPSASLATILRQLYARNSCESSAIVTGHLRSAATHLSASETALYTDYLFTVDTVLKDNVVSPLRSGAEIIVTRPGGVLSLPEGLVNMYFREYPALQENNTYLLFLRFISASSAYSPAGSFSTLRLDTNNNIWTITRTSFSDIRLPEMGRGTLETTIADWRKLCR